MTFEEIKATYESKPPYKIFWLKSKYTGKYVAIIFETVTIANRRYETTDIALKNISTNNIDEYHKFIKPYVQERSRINTENV